MFESEGNNETMQFNKFLRLLRLGRLYRIVKILNFMKVWDGLLKNKTYERFLIMLKMNSGIKRLLKGICAFFFLCHLFGCFWFYTARYSNFHQETW